MAKEENNVQYSLIDIDGVKYKTILTEKFKQRKKYEEKNPNMIRAFIPGTILKILIKNKRKVKDGDIVLILEAMKMMNSVIAPMDGEIKLRVKEGDIVSKNQILFEII